GGARALSRGRQRAASHRQRRSDPAALCAGEPARGRRARSRKALLARVLERLYSGGGEVGLNLNATITVRGDPGLLREYRAEVNRALDEEGGESYRELHSAERLEYEFRLRGGIPFPPFVSASQAFPDLTVEVQWSDAALGRSGRAVIRNGVLAEQGVQSQAPTGSALQEVRADADGGLDLALACARWREFWHGYVIAQDQHAFFRIAGSGGSCELFASYGIEAEWAERWTVASGDADYAELAPREPIAEDELRELDRLAQEFSREWIWFEDRSEEHTSELQSLAYLVCRLLLEKKKQRSDHAPPDDNFVVRFRESRTCRK